MILQDVRLKKDGIAELMAEVNILALPVLQPLQAAATFVIKVAAAVTR